MVKYTSDVTLYRAGEGKKNQMIKKDNTSKQIRIYCLVVGIISFYSGNNREPDKITA